MKRARVVLAACVALALPVAAQAPVGAATDGAATTTRLKGEDRYGTAARLATAAFEGEQPKTVIIAYGGGFPDGLAAAYLAGVLDAPILLARRDVPIPQPTLDAISILKPTKAILVGGTGVLSKEVQDKLSEEGLIGPGNVRRLAGNGRVETAVTVVAEGAADIGTIPDLSGKTTDQLRTAILAYGWRFPDALAAGSLAFGAHLPLLLTAQGELSAPTRFVLEDASYGIEQVVIVGGTGSVSSAVASQVAAIDGVRNVTRVAGTSRTATAAALASLATGTLGWDGVRAAIATGEDFPDALALAPLAGRRHAPILLSVNATDLGRDAFRRLQDGCAPLTEVYVAGGTNTVSDDVKGLVALASGCADSTFAISGSQEPDGGDPDASGTGWLYHDPLCYAFDVQHLDKVVSAVHIHEASADTSGPVVATLKTGAFAAGCLSDGDVDGRTAAQLDAAIKADPTGFYLNVHTPDHVTGAARGQLG